MEYQPDLSCLGPRMHFVFHSNGKRFFHHICLSSLVFIRSIGGSAPFKVLELCIIWIRIGVENMVTCSCVTLLLASRTKTSSKDCTLFSLSLSCPRLRTVHTAIVCLGSSFRMIGFFKCSQTDKTITHVHLYVCVCLMWYELIDDELLVVYTTTLSRTGTETETARTQERKSSRG